MKLYENDKKDCGKVQKLKIVEDKAKALLTLNKSTYNKTEILTILQWKLGVDFNNHKDKRVSDLQALLLEHADRMPDDIILPPAPEQPSIPDIDRTEVGRMKQVQFQNLLQNSSAYDNEQLQQLANQYLSLCAERGIEIKPVWRLLNPVCNAL